MLRNISQTRSGSRLTARRLPMRSARLRGQASALADRRAARRNPARATRSAAEPIILDSSSENDDLDSDNGTDSETLGHNSDNEDSADADDFVVASSAIRTRQSLKRPAPREDSRNSVGPGRFTKRLRTNCESSDDVGSPKLKQSRIFGSVTRAGAQPQKKASGSIQKPATDVEPVKRVTPPWADLPYHVLVPIFSMAAESMEEDAGAQWLLKTSRTCRAFAEPSLTALYKCPPLRNRQMANDLVQLLLKEPSETAFNYKSKIVKLRVDVQEITLKRYKHQPLSLVDILPKLPRLRILDFYHSKDMPSFSDPPTSDSLRWSYSPSLFQAIGAEQPEQSSDNKDTCLQSTQNVVKLRGWRWNTRLMGNLQVDGIKQLHATPAFGSLEKISYVNYQLPSLSASKHLDDKEAVQMDQDYLRSVADTISILLDLQSLSLESSTIVNGFFLPLLPKNLRSLTLINCREVDANDLAAFLRSHGRQLEHLDLHNNALLSMAFITELGSACPKLKTLSMDFNAFNSSDYETDSDYSHVLTANQIPKWPSELESIELRNVRWDNVEAATTLFQSLIDNARHLPKLRHLNIKAMLSIPIWARCEFRDTWENKLKKVFLREWEEPKPPFSLRSWPMDGIDALDRTPQKQHGRGDFQVSPSRRSSRIAILSSTPSSRSSSMCQNLRSGRAVARPMYAEPDSDEDFDESEGDSHTEDDANEVASPSDADVFIHGKCEVVDIQLDNQKPRERMYTAEDFVDSESDYSVDEEWNGRDVDYSNNW